MCPQSAELGSWNSTFPPRSPTLMGAAIERGRKLKNSKWRQEMSFFAQLPWAISSNIHHASVGFYQIILIRNWINLDYTRIFNWLGISLRTLFNRSLKPWSASWCLIYSQYCNLSKSAHLAFWCIRHRWHGHLCRRNWWLSCMMVAHLNYCLIQMRTKTLKVTIKTLNIEWVPLLLEYSKNIFILG